MTNRLRWMCAGVVLLATASWAQTSAERVDSTRKLVAAWKFKEAVPQLDALAKTAGLDRPSVVALFELQGLTYGGLKQLPKARTAFQKLLTLEPEFKLKGKVPPKAQAAFKDAKKWVAQRGGGGLKAEQLTPEIKDKLVTALYISLENDWMSLVKTARVHLKLDAAPWQVKDLPAQTPLNVPAGGKAVQWWLELLGEQGAVLLVLGSESEPIVDAVPGAVVPKATAVAATTQKKDAPVAESQPNLVPADAEPKPDLKAKSSKDSGPRVVPWVLAGAGVVSAGVGTYFAVQSSSARGQVTNPTVDPGTGHVTSITRAEALQLEQQAQTNAAVGNTLIGVGAGLVVAGVVALIVGGN